MAQIVINEISQNYSYNIGTNSFACVALPITSSWGPGYFDPETYLEDEVVDVDEYGSKHNLMLERTTWQRFPATQSGLESFVSTYRGPAARYRLAKDYSYQIAMTLLTSGYDLLVCRICPGVQAQNDFIFEEGIKLNVKAKYPGSFGNNLQVVLTKINPTRKNSKPYWNIITYIVDTSGIRTAVENKLFVFDIENSSDTILHIDELESNFLTFNVVGKVDDTKHSAPTNNVIDLTGGSDMSGVIRDGANEVTTTSGKVAAAAKLAKSRYAYTSGIEHDTQYEDSISDLKDSADDNTADILYYKEWIYTKLVGYASDDATIKVDGVLELLKDKLTYNPNRVVVPGWDDMNTLETSGNMLQITGNKKIQLSPIHVKLMEVAYWGRCMTALIDIPRSLPRSKVHNETDDQYKWGYAQALANYEPDNAALTINGSLYASHSALFAPWGQYTYVGTNKMNPAPPSFIALMVQRAQILNQSIQYEWALPTNRKHNLKIGKLDYNVPKKLLDVWQKLEGVGVNVITSIPDLGTNIWGNSTLYEVPPATYQALANLSTRYLVNAIEDVVYRNGIAITFRYNNNQAYDAFYAGCTPILDTMKNVGAIEDYYVKMSADINGLDSVNANSVIGKIYLAINGVINDITVDLIALPPNVDLGQYRS